MKGLQFWDGKKWAECACSGEVEVVEQMRVFRKPHRALPDKFVVEPKVLSEKVLR